jgi:hypothetical protein
MRKRMTIVGVALAVAATALFLLLPSAGVAASGKLADHTLIDGTGGDTAASCRTTNNAPFHVFGSFRAFGGDVTLRVTFLDGDFVEYPIAQDETFSFEQAAGTNPSVDRRIRVTESVGSGSIVGWMSASRAPGSDSMVVCATAAP